MMQASGSAMNFEVIIFFSPMEWKHKRISTGKLLASFRKTVPIPVRRDPSKMH